MKHIPGILIAIFIFVVVFITEVYANVAVIVNKSNPATDIPYDDLKHILETKKQRWDNGEKITLVFKPITSSETQMLINKIYKIRCEDFCQYWMLKSYNNEISEYPKMPESLNGVIALVSKISGAVGFIGIDEIPQGSDKIKVIRVNGKMPGEDGYPLNKEK
ncbi:MAG TPA: hypothetical protein ACFYEK_16030 [Candidatus Wunengus sp. YC60]|uniref:hypothetical protein n=1 Tax=Candidatus Wunengus sp. YC60 TaxID=3367697 RepID=UPI004025B4E2